MFKGRSRIQGPLEITNNDLNLPKELVDMDASLVWGANGQTYFFKGDKFWRYNNEMKRVDDGYPKFIQDAWRGCPTVSTLLCDGKMARATSSRVLIIIS